MVDTINTLYGASLQARRTLTRLRRLSKLHIKVSEFLGEQVTMGVVVFSVFNGCTFPSGADEVQCIV